jgi:hypothetical protein
MKNKELFWKYHKKLFVFLITTLAAISPAVLLTAHKAEHV